MKYIRTDDGIYELKIDEKLKSNNISNYYFYKLNDRVNICIGKDSLNKYEQADTIEELISRFVLKGIDIILLDKEYTQYHLEGSSVWYDIADTDLRRGIYGAIWTDKGLIYVAKLNEKGELELL